MYLIHTLYIHTYMHMTYITYIHIQALGLEVIVGKMDSSPDLASKQFLYSTLTPTVRPIHTHIHIHTYSHAYIYTYIHTYIRTHIRTHIRTYIIITGCEKD